MTGEEFDRSARRIYRWMLLVAVAGSAGLLITNGWRWAVGFLCGAAGSALLFWWFHRIVGALAPDVELPSQPRLAWLGALRYAVIGAVAYGVVKMIQVEPAAIATGLLVMLAAILMEVLFQIAYGP